MEKAKATLNQFSFLKNTCLHLFSFSRVANIFFFIVLWYSQSGCDAVHSNNSANTGQSSFILKPEAIEAYRSTLYSFGQTQGCVRCHGGRVSPAWLDSNLENAYTLARGLVDFSNPNASIFATYVSNNHCFDPLCADPNNAAVVRSLLSQWANVEAVNASGGQAVVAGAPLPSPSFVTTALPIPSPLPDLTAVNPAVLRFNLSQLNPPIPALNNVFLEVSVRAYDQLSKVYKVSNPRIIGAAVNVRVSGIHVYVRASSDAGLGVEDLYQGLAWAGLTSTAAPYAAPTTLPTTPIIGATPLTPISLGVQAVSASDVLSIGFAQISTN